MAAILFTGTQTILDPAIGADNSYSQTGNVSLQTHKLGIADVGEGIFARTLNKREYELTDHLGNVHVVVSDRKLAVDNGTYSAGVKINATPDGVPDLYTADVLSATDYYAFGMPMPGRQFNPTSYRFGFNGKEKDDEMKGVTGSSYDFGARMLDVRLGRWLSVDPLQIKYPSLSPYHSFANNPIVYVDKDGRENYIYLLVLPSSNTSITSQQVNDIISQANKNFESMGLKTTVVAVKAQGFDISKIDHTDAVAVLGSKGDVVNYVSNNLDKEFGEQLKTGWDGGAGDPEQSELTEGEGLSSDNIIAIDASGLNGAAKNFSITDEKNSTVKTAALSIIHGAGHNAGEGHTSKSIIMQKASVLAKLFSNPKSSFPTTDDVTNNKTSSATPGRKRNESYVSAIIKRFGGNKGKDNYSQRMKK